MKRTDERRAQIALEHMLAAYFLGRSYRVSRRVRHIDGGAVVRFPKGGPHGLKKLHLSPAAIEKIREELLSESTGPFAPLRA
jgi:hypothetical protein